MNLVYMNPVALYPAPPALRTITPRRPGLARLTPVGLSILIHGLFFFYFGAVIFDQGERQTTFSTISVRLQAAPVPTVETTPTASPKTKPSALPQPATSTPAQVKPISPTPLSMTKRPVAIPPIVKHDIPVTQTAPADEIPETTRNDALAEITETTEATEATEQQRQQIKHDYLATLMAHIEAHKHYPRAARQRRLEGQTTVRFTLLASGQICDISISNGPKLLRIASKAALQRALPLPTPPDTLDFPLPIQFNMEYRLI